jgi:hypothetical protein
MLNVGFSIEQINNNISTFNAITFYKNSAA